MLLGNSLAARNLIKRKEERQYQESIQSCATPSPRHEYEKVTNTQGNITKSEPRGHPFLSRWSQGCKEQT